MWHSLLAVKEVESPYQRGTKGQAGWGRNFQSKHASGSARREAQSTHDVFASTSTSHRDRSVPRGGGGGGIGGQGDSQKSHYEAVLRIRVVVGYGKSQPLLSDPLPDGGIALCSTIEGGIAGGLGRGASLVREREVNPEGTLKKS